MNFLDETQTAPPPTSASSYRSRWFAQAGIVLVFGIVFLILSLTVDHFFTFINQRGLLLSVATIGTIACTMLFCLAAGDVDLSVGAICALAGVTAVLATNYFHSAIAGVLAGAAAGGFIGLINGTTVAIFGINSLIATLATMQIVRGLSFIVSNGSSIGVTDATFIRLGISSFFGVPLPIWTMSVCFVLFGLLLHKTIFGRDTLALGGNVEAARLAGINIWRTRLIIFTLQGIVSGLAGVVLAARFSSGQPKTAEGLELQVISACVLGGVSLTGGVGNIGGVIVGVLLLGVVQNVMNLLNIPPFYQYVASGVILLLAVVLDRLQHRAR